MADIWRTRLVWAGIGAGAAVLAIRLAGPGAAHGPGVPVASASASLWRPAADDGEHAAVSARDPAPQQRTETEPGPAVPPEAKAVAATAEDAAAPPDQAAAPDKPAYPLPRMPGSKNLRRTDRFDDALGRWVLTRASRVPAPVFAVEAFFAKALESEGMTVAHVSEPPAADGTRRVTLRGRSKRAKAQVAIRQRPGELITTARVIWQPSA